MCVHVMVWEGGGVEVEVLCSTCTQVTKRDFTSSVAHRRTFYESICFAELRNKVKKLEKIRTRLEPFYKKKALCFLTYYAYHTRKISISVQCMLRPTKK